LRGKQVHTTDVFVRDAVEDAVPKIRVTIDKVKRRGQSTNRDRIGWSQRQPHSRPSELQVKIC
jgi:hypothetical protein